ADIAELLGELQQANLGADDLLFSRHGVLQSAEAGRFTTPTASRPTQWQEWSARIGRVVPAVGIWSPCPIRGCERRRAPAPRSGYALDCRRQSGAEERGVAESDGTLRDAMARGAQELRCSCRPVWPVDRPCARPKATPWHHARHGFKREPDPRRAGDERLERPLRLQLLSPPLCVQPVR